MLSIHFSISFMTMKQNPRYSLVHSDSPNEVINSNLWSMFLKQRNSLNKKRRFAQWKIRWFHFRLLIQWCTIVCKWCSVKVLLLFHLILSLKFQWFFINCTISVLSCLKVALELHITFHHSPVAPNGQFKMVIYNQVVFDDEGFDGINFNISSSYLFILTPKRINALPFVSEFLFSLSRSKAMGVTMCCSSLIIIKAPIFRADHPFFYLIYDNATNCSVFTGSFKQSA